MVMPHWLPNPVHQGPSHGDPPPRRSEDLLFIPDGTYDIGGLTQGRPRNIYARNLGIFGGTVTAGGYVTTGGVQLGTNVQFITGSTVWSGGNAPSDTIGSNGDFYFRSGTPGVDLQRIYVKSGGTWAAIL